jgi:hypothetical protein
METKDQIVVGLMEEFPSPTEEQNELIHIYAEKLDAGLLTFEEAVRLISDEDPLVFDDDPSGLEQDADRE